MGWYAMIKDRSKYENERKEKRTAACVVLLCCHSDCAVAAAAVSTLKNTQLRRYYYHLDHIHSLTTKYRLHPLDAPPLLLGVHKDCPLCAY